MFSRVVSFLRFPMAVLVVYIHTSTDVSCSLGGQFNCSSPQYLAILPCHSFSLFLVISSLHNFIIGMQRCGRRR